MTSTGADVRTLPALRDRHIPQPGSAQWSLPLTEGSLALATPPMPCPTAPSQPRLTLVPAPQSLEQRAGRFVQAVVEVTAGVRPLQQLVRVLSTDVYEQMQHRLSVLARARVRSPRSVPAGRVASVRLYQPRPDAAEVAARIVHESGSRAVATRLEVDLARKDPTWVCTALCWV